MENVSQSLWWPPGWFVTGFELPRRQVSSVVSAAFDNAGKAGSRGGSALQTANVRPQGETRMTSPTSVQEIVDSFTRKITDRLDAAKLDGPVRLDPTRTVVIIPLKDKGPIYVHVQRQINDQGVESVIHQIQLVPSLKGLVVQG